MVAVVVKAVTKVVAVVVEDISEMVAGLWAVTEV
jgi:hypothetical protein